jgi:hypothetical protein
MNRKQFILVLAALAVIGGAGLVLLKHRKESWTVRESKMGDKVLPNFRFNDVAAIHIRGGVELNVVYTDGLWRVRERGGYAANYQQIRDLLMKVRDIKVVQSETIGPSQLARVNLEEPGKGIGSGTLLEFKDGRGQVLAALIAGKRHLRPHDGSTPFGLKGLFDGCYVLSPDDPKNVLLISDELASVAAAPEAWLSRDFYKPENIQTISVAATNPANCWSLSRETESRPWSLTGGEPGGGGALDNTIAAQIAEMLGFLSFVDVVSNTAPSGTGLDQPTLVNILTFDHFAYTLKIGAKGPAGNYCMTVAVTADIPAGRVAGKDEKPEETKELDKEFQDKTKRLRDKLAKEQALAAWIYVADSQMIESLIRDRAQLLEKNTIASDQSAAAKKVPLTVTQ